jgi:hypothetical protein
MYTCQLLFIALWAAIIASAQIPPFVHLRFSSINLVPVFKDDK